MKVVRTSVTNLAAQFVIYYWTDTQYKESIC